MILILFCQGESRASGGEVTCSGHMNNRWYNEDSSLESLLTLPLFLPQSVHLRPGSSRKPTSHNDNRKSFLLAHLSSICLPLAISPSVLLFLAILPPSGPGWRPLDPEAALMRYLPSQGLRHLWRNYMAETSQGVGEPPCLHKSPGPTA